VTCSLLDIIYSFIFSSVEETISSSDLRSIIKNMTIQVNSRVAKQCYSGTVTEVNFVTSHDGEKHTKILTIRWDHYISETSFHNVREIREIKTNLSKQKKLYQKRKADILARKIKSERKYILSLDSTLPVDIVDAALHNEKVKLAVYNTYSRKVLQKHIFEW
jgi:hypothetical protein